MQDYYTFYIAFSTHESSTLTPRTHKDYIELSTIIY